MKYPRSAQDKVGGMYFLPRLLNKIRLHASGELHPDFHANLGLSLGGDGLCCAFLQVAYADLKARVLQGGTDQEIFQWCCEQGRKPEKFDLLIFNEFLRKYGWNDRVTPFLEKLKAESGLAHRTDIQTMMAFFDADEGREP